MSAQCCSPCQHHALASNPEGSPGGPDAMSEQNNGAQWCEGAGQQQDSSQCHLEEKKSQQPSLTLPKPAVAARATHICGAGGVPSGLKGACMPQCSQQSG